MIRVQEALKKEPCCEGVKIIAQPPPTRSGKDYNDLLRYQLENQKKQLVNHERSKSL